MGRDLISAAAMRAQISQIEKYQQAVNTFRGKYGYLPGDIKDPDASNFGFKPRGTNPAQGDGNGSLQGGCGGGGCYASFAMADGEAGAFWVDLSMAQLINASFSLASPTDINRNLSLSQLGQVFPPAQIGAGNFIYVYSGPYAQAYLQPGDGTNYFGLSAVTSAANWYINSVPGLTVRQAYDIDKKIDDGLPQSGNVQATYFNWNTNNYSTIWAAGPGVAGTGSGSYGAYPSTAASAASATTCFDNGGVAGTVQGYSITQNNGAGMNCALSFKFQ